MENASKALLMAGGILIGVLLLALMTTLFISSRELSINYENIKKEEQIQQFNVNFLKYIGEELTLHEVVTIINFANENGVNITGVQPNIYEANDAYSPEKIKTYRISINSDSYSDDGYIKSIHVSSNN